MTDLLAWHRVTGRDGISRAGTSIAFGRRLLPGVGGMRPEDRGDYQGITQGRQNQGFRSSQSAIEHSVSSFFFARLLHRSSALRFSCALLQIAASECWHLVFPLSHFRTSIHLPSTSPFAHPEFILLIGFFSCHLLAGCLFRKFVEFECRKILFLCPLSWQFMCSVDLRFFS